MVASKAPVVRLQGNHDGATGLDAVAERPADADADAGTVDEWDEWADAVPGRRERLRITNEVFMATEALLKGLSDEERRVVGATLYLDAEGVVRARRQQLGLVPDQNEIGSPERAGAPVEDVKDHDQPAETDA